MCCIPFSMSRFSDPPILSLHSSLYCPRSSPIYNLNPKTLLAHPHWEFWNKFRGFLSIISNYVRVHIHSWFEFRVLGNFWSKNMERFTHPSITNACLPPGNPPLASFHQAIHLQIIFCTHLFLFPCQLLVLEDNTFQRGDQNHHTISSFSVWKLRNPIIIIGLGPTW